MGMVSCFLAVLYSLSKTVAHVLSLPLALHHTLAPRLADEDPDSHKYDNIPPELALLVAVIIVLKMVYGFDGQRRCVSAPASTVRELMALKLLISVANNSADPACALPQMNDYVMIFREVKEAYARDKEVLFSASSDMWVAPTMRYMEPPDAFLAGLF
jgi:RNA polymerase I-specific transcription initiation factor RRN7